MKTFSLKLVATLAGVGLLASAAVAAEPATLALYEQQATRDAGASAQQRQAMAATRPGSATRSFSIEFLPGSEAAAGINFDIVFEGAQRDFSANISNCGSALRGSHNGRCEMVAPDRMRVLVFSAPVSAMGAATLVEFAASGEFKGARIDNSSVALSDLRGSALEVDIL